MTIIAETILKDKKIIKKFKTLFYTCWNLPPQLAS